MAAVLSSLDALCLTLISDAFGKRNVFRKSGGAVSFGRGPRGFCAWANNVSKASVVDTIASLETLEHLMLRRGFAGFYNLALSVTSD